MFKTNSKGQSEIITTVLIILLVLAAIIIVWQVVSSTIEEGKSGIEQTSQCIGIDVALVNAGAWNNSQPPVLDGQIVLRRDSVEPEDKPLDVIVLVNGARVKSGTSLNRFDSKPITITNATDDLGRNLVVGDEISVAYTIDGEACPNEPEVVGKVTGIRQA